MKKHTPGPWTVEDYGDDEAPTLVIHRGETENRICFMATPGSHGDPAMIEADARLIAAAPDLLAALKALAAFWAYGLDKPDGAEPSPDDLRMATHLGKMASDAIAKATA